MVSSLRFPFLGLCLRHLAHGSTPSFKIAVGMKICDHHRSQCSVHDIGAKASRTVLRNYPMNSHEGCSSKITCIPHPQSTSQLTLNRTCFKATPYALFPYPSLAASVHIISYYLLQHSCDGVRWFPYFVLHTMHHVPRTACHVRTVHQELQTSNDIPHTTY